MQIDGRLLNAPLKLFWAGWQTDTFQLHKCGWQISAEQSIMDNTMRIAIRHPEAGVMGMTSIQEFLFREVIQNRGRGPLLPTGMRFEDLRKRVLVETIGMGNDFQFHSVDPVPRYEMQSEIMNLEDFAHFKTSPEQAKHSLYLHEANINQILDMAIQKQEPEQERIRQEMIRNKELQEYKRGKLHTELRLVA